MSKILIDEATVKLALEALEWCHGGEPCGTAEAITALQEALAKQPAQKEQGRAHYEDGDVFERIAAMKKQPAQQEPPWWPAVENILNEYGLQAIDFVADFKAAHRKPLTDEEIENIWRRVEASDFRDCVQPFARALEAAHGIKEDA